MGDLVHPDRRHAVKGDKVDERVVVDTVIIDASNAAEFMK